MTEELKSGDKVALEGEVAFFTSAGQTGEQSMVAIEMGSGMDRYRLIVPRRFLNLVEQGPFHGDQE